MSARQDVYDQRYGILDETANNNNLIASFYHNAKQNTPNKLALANDHLSSNHIHQIHRSDPLVLKNRLLKIYIWHWIGWICQDDLRLFLAIIMTIATNSKPAIKSWIHFETKMSFLTQAQNVFKPIDIMIAQWTKIHQFRLVIWFILFLSGFAMIASDRLDSCSWN